jgi:hypothetical protein
VDPTPKPPGCLLWLHADGAVEADGFAVQHGVFDDGTGQLGVFVRLAEARREVNGKAEWFGGADPRREGVVLGD